MELNQAVSAIREVRQEYFEKYCNQMNKANDDSLKSIREALIALLKVEKKIKENYQ